MNIFNLDLFQINADDLLLRRIFLSLLWIIIIRIISFISRKIAKIRISDAKRLYLIRKAVSYLSVLFTLLALVLIWFRNISNISTILGLASAGFAIALKDIISDLAGWTYIMVRKPFSTGDRIEIGNIRGDIVDVGFLKFSMLEVGNWVDSDQSTGRLVFIPNSYIYLQTFVNYSKDFNFIWNEIPIILSFESNWKKAKKILEDIVQKDICDAIDTANRELEIASKKQYIFYKKLTPIIWVSGRENGILLTIRYLCRPRKRRSSENMLWIDILEEFEKHDDIQFAHKTARIYFNAEKGTEKDLNRQDAEIKE